MIHSLPIISDQVNAGGHSAHRPERLVRSRFVRIIETKESEHLIAYHSKFGNLKRIARPVLSLLDMFVSPEEPAKVFGEDYPRFEKTLDFLKDMFFLVDVNTDELTIIRDDLETRRHQVKRGAYVGGLQLSASNACNFQCKMCFVDRSDVQSVARQELVGPANMNMSFETAVKGLHAIVPITKRNGKDSIVVKFFGREPLINWHTIKQVMEYVRDNDIGIHVKFDMTTNGSLVTQGIADALAEHNVHVSISVDGLPRANDKIRITKKKGENTFRNIEQGINLLRDAAVDMHFNSVISSTNFDDYDTRFIDYAVSNNVPSVCIILSFMDDYLRPQRLKNGDEIADKIFEMYEYGDRVGVLVHGYWYNPVARLWKTRRTLSGENTGSQHHDTCAATGFQLNLEPSGDIFACKATSKGLGHIDDLEQLLHSEAYEWTTMRTYNNVPACNGCEIEGFCQGVCLGHIEQKFDDDIYQIDNEYCDVYRAITRRVLQYALQKTG